MKKFLKFILFLAVIFLVIPAMTALIFKIFGVDILSVRNFISNTYIIMTVIKLAAFYAISFYFLPGYFKKRLDELNHQLEFSDKAEERAFLKKKEILLSLSQKKWHIFVGFLVVDLIITHIPYWLMMSSGVHLGGGV